MGLALFWLCQAGLFDFGELSPFWKPGQETHFLSELKQGVGAAVL